jgi:hypothetical protein
VYLISHEGSDKLHGLLKSVRWIAARVQDQGPQAEVGQQRRVGIDLIQGVQHRFHSLKKILNSNFVTQKSIQDKDLHEC